MKIFLLWAVIFTASLVLPTNVTTGFMVGSIFGFFLSEFNPNA